MFVSMAGDNQCSNVLGNNEKNCFGGKYIAPYFCCETRGNATEAISLHAGTTCVCCEWRQLGFLHQEPHPIYACHPSLPSQVKP